jgi:hypothetical protein
MKKNSMNRFAILAVVGSILCSALVVGCGGGSDDSDSGNTTKTTTNTTTKEGDS